MNDDFLHIGDGAVIDQRELQWQFVRASGPGGQNVNKVATAVQLRFDAARAPGLAPAVRERLRRLAGRRMTGEGVIVIDARRFRTQERNRDDALERLVALVRAACTVPKPRRKTKPTLAAKRRRLEQKRQQAERKRRRARVQSDD
ncbi:MAG: alternative ribosome rescue aminoacyl-tRNA hydrolase ArfB [Gammaproteobacteria bacterium]